MPLEYEKETFQLRRCFFEVQNEVGRGRQEEAYHQASIVWFREHGFPVVSKVPHRLFLRGEEVVCLLPDFVGWDSISVELKAVPRTLRNEEFVQIFNYLKYRRDRVGLLVNMGLENVAIERIIYDPPQTEWVENWDAWTGQISNEDRTTGLAIREAIRAVYSEHSTGYGSEIVGRLVRFALAQQGLAIVAEPIAKAYFRGIEVHESPLDCLVVNQRIMLVVSALFETNGFNINRGKSYLSALGLQWGMAANFGKARAEIIGIRSE